MFLYFDYLNNAAVKMGMQFPWECTLWDGYFISFGNIPRSGITGSYGSSVFNFLGNGMEVNLDLLAGFVGRTLLGGTSILLSIMTIPIYIATIAY